MVNHVLLFNFQLNNFVLLIINVKISLYMLGGYFSNFVKIKRAQITLFPFLSKRTSYSWFTWLQEIKIGINNNTNNICFIKILFGAKIRQYINKLKQVLINMSSPILRSCFDFIR